ncbi:metallophosphoesterase 1-like [Uloborus diversus]|uniref:metallophosphoesterase 1-like n=1 Tax=Uloborus diversus TaxID=327109 RepID=UPI002409841A|nr:metallophosphoesterase 1-like [Uloborus diversus]
MLKLRVMRCVRCVNWWHLGKALLLIGFLFFLCEILIYYIVLLQCTWPQIQTHTRHSTVKAVLLADTHLLGPRFGHWFDKLRREWQMYRTFQTTMTLHNPHVVFILGDVFDEGQHCTEEDFNNYVKRFHSLFFVPENTKLYVVIGNHDIGFHYHISDYLKERFEKSFNISSVEMITIKNNVFVLVNSMALHGDDCFLCKPAEEKLREISNILRCSKGDEDIECKKFGPLPAFSPPIFLQHFPLFRPSDAHCRESDSAPEEIINEPFRETWECLSRESTSKVLSLLEPRAVFSGHTHHGCFTMHKEKIPEWTIPSFSWRNKKNPSFILATFAPDAFRINKCHMPNENTVIDLYIVGSLFILIWMYVTRGRFFKGSSFKDK